VDHAPRVAKCRVITGFKAPSSKITWPFFGTLDIILLKLKDRFLC